MQTRDGTFSKRDVSVRAVRLEPEQKENPKHYTCNNLLCFPSALA